MLLEISAPQLSLVALCMRLPALAQDSHLRTREQEDDLFSFQLGYYEQTDG